MSILTSVPAMVWLLISAVFFAGGELFSKTWANSPTLLEVILLLAFYTISTLLWLPALYSKNHLVTTGTVWLLLGAVMTILLGIFIFHEKITLLQGFGILFALAAIVLLNI